MGVVQSCRTIFTEISAKEILEGFKSDSCVLSVVVSYFPCLMPSSIMASSFSVYNDPTVESIYNLAIPWCLDSLIDPKVISMCCPVCWRCFLWIQNVFQVQRKCPWLMKVLLFIWFEGVWPTRWTSIVIILYKNIHLSNVIYMYKLKARVFVDKHTLAKQHAVWKFVAMSIQMLMDSQNQPST